MAFQIQSQIPVPPRKTALLIQCITENKTENLINELLEGRDINGLYHSEDWNDDVTLLTAAVICRNEEICMFLLKNSADPNKQSTRYQTPLHYAAFTDGVPLSIVEKLLAAKADPNGHGKQRFSPLQYAADSGHEDIVKALLEAGASPERHYGRYPELDKKVERMIDRLSSQSEVLKKVHLFFSLFCAVQVKKQAEIYIIFQEHFFEEHPFIPMILFEVNLGVGSHAEDYRQSTIEWLRDTKSADRYIERVIKRFPKIPQEHWMIVLSCLYLALFASESVSPEVFSELVPNLTDTLQHFPNAEGDAINHCILRILHVMMQKMLSQQRSANYLIYENLCETLLPLTYPYYSSRVRVWAYGLFVYVYDIAPELVEFTSIPETILNTAETEMDEVMTKKLQKLNQSLRGRAESSALESLIEETVTLLTCRKRKSMNEEIQQEACKIKRSQEAELQDEEDPNPVVTSVEKSDSSVSFIQPTVNPRQWHKISVRWRPMLEKLANMDVNKIYRLPSLTLVLDPEFLIANGSDGTQVFLGLRDDGTEVAVKRMVKLNYQVLKNEEKFLRLPELDSPSVVRYVDFAEDAHFGYLALQLCEYTLEEYIQDHLPEDKDERTLVLKKLVKEVLCSLQVLHDQQTEVLHRDIKPQNVLIDINGKARLADFGISRRLKQNETTLRTSIAGTRCWKAKETIDEEVNTGYKRSSDIQVAGMLVYYILSGGHHPFGKGAACEYNVLQGRYSLEHLEDDVAKDLIEWMINEDPNNRPTVEQSLAHPFFWTDERRVEYLKTIGNQNEAESCRKVDEELLHAVERFTEGKSFSQWKTKFPPKLVWMLENKRKGYPRNTLGLLRFIRNLHEHYPEDAESINLMASFPDLFGSVFRFAKERGWHSRASLKKFFSSAPQT